MALGLGVGRRLEPHCGTAGDHRAPILLNPLDQRLGPITEPQRRLEGIARADFAERTGFEIDALVGEPLRKFVEHGLLADDGQRVRLTREGLFVSDAMWPEFLRA